MKSIKVSIFENSEKQMTGNTQHFLDKKTIVNLAYWTSKKSNDYTVPVMMVNQMDDDQLKLKHILMNTING